MLFQRELRQAEKDNEEANAMIPLSERDEEDKAEGYIMMSESLEPGVPSCVKKMVQAWLTPPPLPLRGHHGPAWCLPCCGKVPTADAGDRILVECGTYKACKS